MAKDDILGEARQRFRYCHDFEAQARSRFVSDMKFALASPDTPQWQWQQAHIDSRARQQKPTLVVNKVRQHALSVINEGRQSPPEVKIRPVGDGATVKAAEVFQGIIRHIFNNSNGQAAIDTASWFQVTCGIGYWRVLTDYADDENSFSQEIKIVRIPNPLNVYLDPDIQEFSGEDARYGFVFRDMPIDQFRSEYPKYADLVGRNTTFSDDQYSGWLDENQIRVAEYYYRKEKHDKLHLLANGMTIKRSEVKAEGPNLLQELDDNTINTRDITTNEIHQCLIAGSEIVEQGVWAGKYIPIVRLIGEETNVDGVLDRYGMTRHLKDSQRIYNWMSSSAVESIGIQTKVPFLAPNESVEEYMDQWSTANNVNHSILTYRQYNDAGQELRPPERIEPPTMPSAYLEALKLSSDELNAVSGQYEASFGAPSNERSGKAIDARNRIASNSSYHFVTHLGEAIRYTGKILLDLIPKVMDVQSVIKIIGEDGTVHSVMLDPNHPQSHTEMPNTDLDDTDENDIYAIFNPNVGQYSVIADIGPSYASKRLELFNSLSDILSQNESLTPIVGDLLFRAMDVPEAELIADRLKRMVPPQALGQQDPQVAQLQQQLQQMSTIMNQLTQKLHDSESKNVNASLQKDVDIYNAETKRMEVIGKSDPEVIRAVARTMLSEILAMPANHLIAMQAIEAAQLNSVTNQIGQPQPGQAQPQPQPQQPMQ